MKSYFPFFQGISDPTVDNLDNRILQLLPHLLNANKMQINANKCKHPSCKTAININGNHKITRLTCLYNEIKIKSLEINSTLFYLLKCITNNNIIITTDSKKVNCSNSPERNTVRPQK